MVAYNDTCVKPEQCHEETGSWESLDIQKDEGDPFSSDKLACTGNGTIKRNVCKIV